MSTAISNQGYSYEWQNKVRDVNEIFMQLISQSPVFAALIANGAGATNTKVEWLEDQITPVNTAITGFDTDGDGTGVNVTSTTGIKANSILRFTTAADVTRTELVKVASVDSATDLTVVRDYGGSTGVTLVVGDLVYLVSTPKTSSTSPEYDVSQEAGTAFNYTQIIDRTARVSKTSEAVKMYGLSSALNNAVQFQMAQMAYDLNNSAIYGRKVARSATEPGSMGGVLQFLEGGNIDTTGGAISSTIINNLLESIYLDGNIVKDLAIICNTNQARKISTFLTAANQPTINKPDVPNQSAGFAISKVYGDLPLNAQFGATVAVDPQFPKDQLAIIDLTKVNWRWLRGMTDENAAGNGDDYYARRILGELSLEVKNGTTSHGLATGLTV
jgi:hypothetical protein